MSDLHPVAGCKFYIGDAAISLPSIDATAATFTSVTWVEVKGWTSMGEVGDTAQVITTSLIGRGRDVKQKGTFNAGSMANTFAVIDEDPGQLALIAGRNADDNYPFRVVMNDTPVSGGTPSERLFIGL
ncbi:MAG: hypothetical protein AAF449_03915, partial [Myxococcota bacterium]